MELKKMNFMSDDEGFTLIELLIAMAMTLIVAAAILTSFQSQQKTYVTQENVAQMQQNLRAGMEMMVQEIRMAGYDRLEIEGLGIIDISPRDMSNNPDGTTLNGNGYIQISADYDDNGVLGGDETISFSILNPDGKPDLIRDDGGGQELLSENIEALGLAYAYDADDDGNLDLSAGGHIIWAVDTESDNDLDRALDVNDDGSITIADGPIAAGNSGVIAGSAIVPNVTVDKIRAVRIWVLARTDRKNNEFINTHTYVVGHKVITPSNDGDPNNDNYQMRLLTATVQCRNLGL